MLKIKNFVDLKELEKFGFKEKEHDYIFTTDEDWEIIGVQKCNRYIYFETKPMYYGSIFENLLYKLFDLIQAGLVEKVVEE